MFLHIVGKAESDSEGGGKGEGESGGRLRVGGGGGGVRVTKRARSQLSKGVSQADMLTHLVYRSSSVLMM